MTRKRRKNWPNASKIRKKESRSDLMKQKKGQSTSLTPNSIRSTAIDARNSSGGAENRLGSRYWASENAGVQGASIAVDRKSMGHTVGERWWRNVVFSAFSVAVMEKCFDACG
jgi:hypothetical protein